MFEQIKDWWEGASEREQKLLLISAVVVFIGLIYFALWQPMSDELARKQQSLTNTQQRLTWVDKNSKKLIEAGVGTRKASNKSNLSQLINKTAKRYQINISRIQSRDGKVDVWINSAEFDQFVEWITKLQNQYGIFAQTVDISRGKEKGLIKVSRLSLSY